MKADDYAKRLLAKTREEVPEEASLVIRDMLIEAMDIAKARNARSNQAMIAIIKEQGIKWLAIVDRCSDYIAMNPAAFRIAMLKCCKETCQEIPYRIWCKMWPESTMSLTVRALENKIWTSNLPELR